MWNPLTLRFHDARLEAAFWGAPRVRDAFLAVDKAATVLVGLNNTLLVWRASVWVAKGHVPKDELWWQTAALIAYCSMAGRPTGPVAWWNDISAFHACFMAPFAPELARCRLVLPAVKFCAWQLAACNRRYQLSVRQMGLKRMHDDQFCTLPISVHALPSGAVLYATIFHTEAYYKRRNAVIAAQRLVRTAGLVLFFLALPAPAVHSPFTGGVFGQQSAMMTIAKLLTVRGALVWAFAWPAMFPAAGWPLNAFLQASARPIESCS